MNFLFSGAKTFNELFHDKSGSNICLQHHNFSIISHLSGAKLIFINSFVIKEAAILVYSVIILFHYWIIVAPPGGILNYNMTWIYYSINKIDLFALNYERRTASCPEVFLPSFLLPIVPCASSPVTRVLRSPLCEKTKLQAPEEEAGRRNFF